VKPDAKTGAAEKAQDCGGSGKELEIDGRIDTLTAHTTDRFDGVEAECSEGRRLNGDNVFGRNNIKQIEDKPVLTKDDYENILPPDSCRRRPERRFRQHGGSLLGKLDENHALRFGGLARV
jgi:hypothetical protein